MHDGVADLARCADFDGVGLGLMVLEVAAVALGMLAGLLRRVRGLLPPGPVGCGVVIPHGRAEPQFVPVVDLIFAQDGEAAGEHVSREVFGAGGPLDSAGVAVAVDRVQLLDQVRIDEDLPVGIAHLTINEIRRLWNRVVMRVTHTVDHTLKWSEWRFRARQWARTSHYRRRERHNLSLQYWLTRLVPLHSEPRPHATSPSGIPPRDVRLVGCPSVFTELEETILPLRVLGGRGCCRGAWRAPAVCVSRRCPRSCRHKARSCAARASMSCSCCSVAIVVSVVATCSRR